MPIFVCSYLNMLWTVLAEWKCLNTIYCIFSDVLPSALDTSSGTATNSISPHYFPSENFNDSNSERQFPYTYPYFLFPPSHKIHKILALAADRPTSINSEIKNTFYSHPHSRHPNTYSFNGTSANSNGHSFEKDDTMSTFLNHFNRTNSLHKSQHQHHSQNIIIDNINSDNINNNNKNFLHNLHHFRDNRSSSEEKMHKHHQDYKKHRLEIGENMHL